MLSIPAGRYTLTKHLTIKRSRLVLRGAGSGKTTLNVPKSEGQRKRKGKLLDDWLCSKENFLFCRMSVAGHLLGRAACA